jgi:two-component system chemotaxis sensor kinase CheA
MGRLVKHVTVYSGCTILGDGRVIMILDTTGIAASAMRAGTAERDPGAKKVEGEATHAHDRETILLFDAGFPALQAVPLSRVARLEEIGTDQIEEADGRLLVQYRGALLPLIPANPAMDVRARSPRPVVVFAHQGRSMGLAVEEIRDIVEERIALETDARRPGVLGVGVINGKATEVIDIGFFLEQALGHAVEVTS